MHTKKEIQEILLDRKLDHVQEDLNSVESNLKSQANRLKFAQKEIRDLRPKNLSKLPYIQHYVRIQDWEQFLIPGQPLSKQPEIVFNLKLPTGKIQTCKGFQDLTRKVIQCIDQNYELLPNHTSEKPRYQNGKMFRKPVYLRKCKRYFELDQTIGRLMLEIFGLLIEINLPYQKRQALFSIKSATPKR